MVHPHSGRDCNGQNCRTVFSNELRAIARPPPPPQGEGGEKKEDPVRKIASENTGGPSLSTARGNVAAAHYATLLGVRDAVAVRTYEGQETKEQHNTG